MKPLSARQQQVLQATVHHYVDTMEPVGSRTLVQRFGIPASSATVRSAMGALEKRGLLTQPHTSAGRIPSALGYRRYVDDLLPKPGVAVQYLERELTGLSLRWAALDDLLQQLARRLTDFTGLMSLITRPQQPRAQLEAIRLVQSGDRLLVMLVEDSGPRQPPQPAPTARCRRRTDGHGALDRSATGGRQPQLAVFATPAATQRRRAAQRTGPSIDVTRDAPRGAWPLQAGGRAGIPEHSRAAASAGAD